jgi:hypothetical protein
MAATFKEYVEWRIKAYRLVLDKPFNNYNNDEQCAIFHLLATTLQNINRTKGVKYPRKIKFDADEMKRGIEGLENYKLFATSFKEWKEDDWEAATRDCRNSLNKKKKKVVSNTPPTTDTEDEHPLDKLTKDFRKGRIDKAYYYSRVDNYYKFHFPENFGVESEKEDVPIPEPETPKDVGPPKKKIRSGKKPKEVYDFLDHLDSDKE